MRTLDELRELNPAEVMLVGSAALALYGANLPQYDSLTGKSGTRPGDIDLATTGQYTDDLYQLGISTPGGITYAERRPQDIEAEQGGPPIHSSRRRDTILQLHGLSMPVDVITGYHDGDNLQRYDDAFRRIIARNSVPLQGSAVRIATPKYMKDHLSLRARGGDLKAQSDLRSFSQALLRHSGK